MDRRILPGVPAVALVLAMVWAWPAAPTSAGAPDRAAAVRVRDITYDYKQSAIAVMPREKVPIAVVAPDGQMHRIDVANGTLSATGSNRWSWVAPAEPGLYELEVKSPEGDTIAELAAFVMVPASEIVDGRLKGFDIGLYPGTPLRGNPIYLAPKGFIEVTRENEDRKVSPHFEIRQFLTKQKSGYPKYVVLDEGLIFLLEAIGRHLEPLGWDAGDIVVMSGYRTPFYNKQLDDTEYSLHQWGRASDIFLDKDGNGVMDDVNKDRAVSKEDAVALAGILESLSRTPELARLIGGIGIYDSTAAHGPFVHVDTRPWRARW